MTINIADNTPRVSYSVAEGVTQTSFTVSFEFFDDEDLNVYVDGTLKTLTTDYTVSGGSGTTGTVTISVTGGTGGSTVVITRDIELERTTDFPASGAFQINSLNTELDRITAIAADLNDLADRGLRLKDQDDAVSTELPLKADRVGRVLGFNATTGVPEAGPLLTDVSSLASITADIATLADIEDGTDATDAIQTVAGISSNVTTVAGIASNVTTVAGISADVTSVAADATDIGTVATNIASVNTVAGNISEVIAVANDLNEAVSEVETVANDLNEAVSEIETVAASITNVDTVGTNIANVNTVAGISSNVTTVAGISANVTTVAGISSNVTTVAGISSDVTAVAADATDIGTVSSNIANVNTVAGNTTNINTVAGISANVTTVAGISANVTTVAGISSDVTAVAADATDIGTVATNIANVNSVGGSISNVNTVASNLSSVNDFADKYRIGASDPTIDNDEGDLFYNTTTDTLKVYTGTAWEQGVTAGSGFLPTTGGSLTGNVSFGDNNKAIFGAGSDLQIYHNGTDSYIDDAGTGDLYIRASDDLRLQVRNDTDTAWVSSVIANDGGETSLHYNGTKKIATTSGGIDVTGTVTADGLVLDGNIYRSVDNQNIVIAGGTNDSGATIRLFGSTHSSLPSDMYFDADDHIFRSENAATTKMKITSGGDVSLYDSTGVTQGLFWDASTQRLGLGTTSPSAVFELSKSSGNAILTLNRSNTNTVGRVGAINFTASDGHSVSAIQAIGDGDDDGAHLTFYTTSAASSSDPASNERMRINASGNVGIGTASPNANAKLTLSGAGLEVPTGYGVFNDTGGANATGINFTAAGTNTLTFITGNSEKARIDSSGNVGIGTSSPSYKLHSTTSSGSDFAGYFYNTAGSGNGTSLVARGGANNATPNFQVQDYGGNADFTVTGDGNVGIGTAAPATKLHVEGSALFDVFSSGGGIYFREGFLNTDQTSITVTDHSGDSNKDGLLISGYDGVSFRTAASERMRIDSSGNLLVGTTSATFGSTNYGIGLKDNAESNWVVDTASNIIAFSRNSNGDVFKFFRGNLVGSVSVTGSVTSYNTSSDYRLKENVTEVTGAADRVKALNPVRFNFIADPDTTVDGFLAHEVADVVPEAISGTKDAVDDEGNPEYQGIDQSKLVPLLTAALQEALSKIDDLESRLAALEAN